MTSPTNKKVANSDIVASIGTGEAHGTPQERVGHFIVMNTAQVKGLRLNLDKVRNYAFNDVHTIQIAWDNGVNTTLKYSTQEDAQEAMARLDSYCL